MWEIGDSGEQCFDIPPVSNKIPNVVEVCKVKKWQVKRMFFQKCDLLP